VVLRGRSLCINIFLYFGSSAGYVGLGDKEEREKDMQLSAHIELYIFIYSINKHIFVDVSLGRG
jgi:hypothetical protein